VVEGGGATRFPTGETWVSMKMRSLRPGTGQIDFDHEMYRRVATGRNQSIIYDFFGLYTKYELVRPCALLILIRWCWLTNVH
jgi:hypothetical protein